ncbi:hypothetical protein [Dapis sp. BLCC M229]|uniref:hypothetical protein n=1 Tax=Dapis sp. BLCC M229 TaxID=3400188 RepID=UPI003CEED093
MSEKIYHFIACFFSGLFQLQLLEIECIRKYKKEDKEQGIGEDTKIYHLFFTEKLRFKASPFKEKKRSFAEQSVGWDGEVSSPYPIDQDNQKIPFNQSYLF